MAGIPRLSFWNDLVNNTANMVHRAADGTRTVIFLATGTAITQIATTIAGTLTTTGVLSANGLLVPIGRIREVMTPTDVDAQNNTLTAAQIVNGIVVHTSVTAGGTVTTDTAANIVAGVGNAALTADGQCLQVYYVNDGTQVLTFAGGAGVTIADTGQTVAADESAILLFRRTGASAVTMYAFGG